MTHILIVGNGSIGKRHARNLKTLGCDISIVDPRKDRRYETEEELKPLGTFYSLTDALSDFYDIIYDGVFICTPPADHVEQCLQCIKAGIPIYLEKGVSLDYPEAKVLQDEVEKTNHLLLMGYSWRWWPSIQKLERLMFKVGTIRRVEMVIAAHLADWHPWEKYQDFYIASRGGVENESHWIDLMLKWWGMPGSLFSRLEHISDLETTTNDNLEIWCEYPEHRVHIHFDLYSRPHEKFITIVGEKGTLFWTPEKIVFSNDPGWTDNREDAWSTQGKSTEIYKFDTERNEMFIAAAREFLFRLSGSLPAKMTSIETPLTCSIEDGTKVMQVLNLARMSHQEGKIVSG